MQRIINVTTKRGGVACCCGVRAERRLQAGASSVRSGRSGGSRAWFTSGCTVQARPSTVARTALSEEQAQREAQKGKRRASYQRHTTCIHWLLVLQANGGRVGEEGGC